MIASDRSSLHASAVMVGDRAVLIRGASGSGKSRLAFDLILAGRAGQIPETILVGDDRVRLEAADGRLIVRAVTELAGMIEIRGLGIRRCPFAETAVVWSVVDMDADDSARMPSLQSLATTILNIGVARIPVPPGYAALPLVIAALTMTEKFPDPDSPQAWG